MRAPLKRGAGWKFCWLMDGSRVGCHSKTCGGMLVLRGSEVSDYFGSALTLESDVGALFVFHGE